MPFDQMHIICINQTQEWRADPGKAFLFSPKDTGYLLNTAVKAHLFNKCLVSLYILDKELQRYCKENMTSLLWGDRILETSTCGQNEIIKTGFTAMPETPKWTRYMKEVFKILIIITQPWIPIPERWETKGALRLFSFLPVESF